MGATDSREIPSDINGSTTESAMPLVTLAEGADTTQGLRDTVDSKPLFSVETFQLLELLHAQPTKAVYQERKDAFKTHIEAPLEKLFREVARRLPDAMTEQLETKNHILAKILKNDYGQGGAWEYLWGAFYPKGGKRIEGAQLYISVNHKGLNYGFSIADNGKATRQIFATNLDAMPTDLGAKLSEGLASDEIVYGVADDEDTITLSGLAAVQTRSFEKWIKNISQYGPAAKIYITKEQLGAMPGEVLAEKIANLYEKLFPLFRMTMQEEPFSQSAKQRGLESNLNIQPGHAVGSNDLSRASLDALAPYGAIHKMRYPTQLDQGIIPALNSALKDAGLIVSNATVIRFISALVSKRFILATGLSGSGKTKLAQVFARWITPTQSVGDVFSPGSEIKSANITYYVKRSDCLSVEFWNAANEDDATKVSLPREMIVEWADYIERNMIPQTTQAREIREAVKVTSKFSDQLHSFETHLKAAAFALINSQSQETNGSCYAVVPVGADWTGNENILGYPDGLQATQYVAKPALDLILHAADHAEVPHFLILDEMNLSHVERYFADILSVIESNEGLELYSGDMEKPETWRKTTAAKPVPPKLKKLPENLFVIGTVNVDETTYMFSPKVLDRANVIEFRMDVGDLEGFLGNPAKPDLSKLDGKGASFGTAFVNAAKNSVAVPGDVKAYYDAEMMLIFKTLQAHGAEFGYRTAYETARFIHFYKLFENHPDGDSAWFPGAFDCVIFQKMLPKLHGSRAKLGPVLRKLWFLCVNDAAGRGADALKAAEEAARSTDKKTEPSVVVPEGAPYPLSAEKIGRMWRLLLENGFASFAEA